MGLINLGLKFKRLQSYNIMNENVYNAHALSLNVHN